MVVPFPLPVTGLGIHVKLIFSFSTKEKCWLGYKEHLSHSWEKDLSFHHCGVWIWHLELCIYVKANLVRDGRVGRWEDSASSLAVMSCWTKQPCGIALGLSDIADPYDRDSVLLKGKYILINYHIVWKFSANFFYFHDLLLKSQLKKEKQAKGQSFIKPTRWYRLLYFI